MNLFGNKGWNFIGDRKSGTDTTNLGGNVRTNQRLDGRAVTPRVSLSLLLGQE
jgi:hypothetical protein